MRNQELNLLYLQTHLKRVDAFLRQAVTYARAAGFDPNNEFQGLYVADDEIERHLRLDPGAGFWGRAGLVLEPDALSSFYQSLSQIEAEAERTRTSLRLQQILTAFDLDEADLDILLISLAPAVDRRYERIYGFLQDDVTKRRPTVNLVVNLLGTSWLERNALLEHLADESPLIQHGLVTTIADPSDPHAALNNRMVKVDARVVQYVLGIDSLPKQTYARMVPNQNASLNDLILNDPVREIAQRNYGDIVPIFHIYGNYGSGQIELAAVLSRQQHCELIEVDLQALQQSHDELVQAEWVFREGRMRQAALALTHWETLLDAHFDPPQWFWQKVLEYPHPVILTGHEAWEPRGMERNRPLLRIELGIPDFEDRLAYWQRHLGDVGVDPAEIAYKFKLTGGQVRDTVYTAYDLALGKGLVTPSLAELYAASRAQSNRKLSGLATKITPNFSWDSLVLPDDRIQMLQEICSQVKHAVQVYGRWGFKGRGADSQGVTALFAGQSGTGKTMSAEIIAYELGLDLFKIDLSSVVSKYIGETEKNLAAIFDEAAQSNAILFFDEADALFGKRSEVKDSHDRYANIEIGYLLQRMETYDGIAILASNLRQNLDEAFTRRLDFLVDFPFPEEEDRLKIWQISFPATAPLGPDVDLTLIANRYRLAGGNIRNAALASAFLAAADGTQYIHMVHILHGIRREHQKMGKLLEDDLVATYQNMIQ